MVEKNNAQMILAISGVAVVGVAVYMLFKSKNVSASGFPIKFDEAPSSEIDPSAAAFGFPQLDLATGMITTSRPEAFDLRVHGTPVPDEPSRQTIHIIDTANRNTLRPDEVSILDVPSTQAEQIIQQFGSNITTEQQRNIDTAINISDLTPLEVVIMLEQRKGRVF